MFQPRSFDLNDTTSERDYVSNYSRKTGSKRRKSPYQSEALSHHQPSQKQVAKIGMNVAKEEYPTDFSQCNPFCPYCGKYVTLNSNFVVFHASQKRKKYLLHDECFAIQSKKQITVSEAPQAKLQSASFLNHVRSIALGGRQFYVELQILHPFGGFSFLKMWTKVKSIRSQITWDMKNMDETDCFCPNIIAFPIPQFEISLNLTEMGEKDSNIVKKAVINVGRLGGKQTQFIKAYTQDIQITMRIIGDKQEQIKTIDDMNMKYRYPIEVGTSLVEIMRIQIKIPSEESDDSDNQVSFQSNSRITEQLSQKSTFREERSLHNSEALSERSFQRQKIDLQKLINSSKLSDYVRQNTQSRVFQNWLGEATPPQIDQVVSSLWEELPELITHEYANYMVQKLLGVCSLAQRLRIVQRLQADIPVIARNKQGTHSLQTLIALFTDQQEYRLVCQSVKSSYLSLAIHPNATHFLQKIITKFPLVHTIDFIQIVNNNFLSYALDKNAMCVIKQMISRISDLQGSVKPGQAPQARRNFLHSVIFNLDRIITDPYGNYIVQFCYEFFGQERCGAITQRIIEKFTQFSLQKYASAVLHKCVSSYWISKDTLQKLKISLTPEGILELFRSKQGNKVLLQIMEKHQGSALREKIQNQLMVGQLTKFNRERWGVALGSRSGIVGTEFNCFTDAVKKSSKKKKYYNNIN